MILTFLMLLPQVLLIILILVALLEEAKIMLTFDSPMVLYPPYSDPSLVERSPSYLLVASSLDLSWFLLMKPPASGPYLGTSVGRLIGPVPSFERLMHQNHYRANPSASTLALAPPSGAATSVTEPRAVKCLCPWVPRCLLKWPVPQPIYGIVLVPPVKEWRQFL